MNPEAMAAILVDLHLDLADQHGWEPDGCLFSVPPGDGTCFACDYQGRIAQVLPDILERAEVRQAAIRAEVAARA